VAWTPKARRNWINFSERVGKLHLKRLDHYGVQYRISLPGINLPLLAKGILDANVEFPGLALRYNLSKTTPSSSALLYSKPVKSKGIVSIRTFNSMNRGSRSIMVSDHLDNAAT
jgi:hexosaminidase